MDGSRYKNFDDNVAAVGYSQEQSKHNTGNRNQDSRNIQNKLPFLEEINLSNQFHYKTQTAEHSAVQQPNLYPTIPSKSGAHTQPQGTFQESKQIAIDNSNDSKNRQQLLLPYKSIEEYNYQQQNMDSGIRIQKQFQNITFPTNIKENLNVLPHLISARRFEYWKLWLFIPSRNGEKNYNNNANLNDNEASSQDVNSNYNYNNDHSSAYDRTRGEVSNIAFNSATNSYANPKTNFLECSPNQMNTEPHTTEDATYGSGKIESIQSKTFQDSVSTHSESNENQNNGFENFPKQFAMNYDSPINQNFNYRSPDTQYVYQNMKEKTSANDAFRSLNQEVYNVNPTSNTEDGSSKYGSYYAHSDSRSLSGNSQMKLGNEPHQNLGVYSTNQQTNSDLEEKDLVETSMRFSNSSEQERISGKKPKKDILQPSTPEAVLLVLVSSKNTHPVNYHNNEESSSSEEANESSAVKVVQLLKQDQNAQSLIESFYSSAKREENQESTDNLNQKYSPKTKKQK
ncbi:hypothetical protein TNCV_3171681 [Trichonephila clavipes]|nr:hypothetical protein TNCV_3171681 [Trichonephila clavipes]